MKTQTIICDIDGVLIAHRGKGASKQWTHKIFDPLPGIREQFDKWESEAATIVLMTARKESCRGKTEHELRSMGLYWDHLIMGVGHGPRILINDAKPDSWSVLAIELPRNEGLVKYEKHYSCRRFINASIKQSDDADPEGRHVH